MPIENTLVRWALQMQSQRDYLGQFLSQWEAALEIYSGGEPAEAHISGDINLDALNELWFNKPYHLYSLAKMLHSSCNLGNFTQLVK